MEDDEGGAGSDGSMASMELLKESTAMAELDLLVLWGATISMLMAAAMAVIKLQSSGETRVRQKTGVAPPQHGRRHA
jgi:hypothetical protein